MVFHLNLKANLQGLTDLAPVDTDDSPFEYTFLIQCTSCREQHDKEITINRLEQHDLPGSRGEANFVFKCKSCGHLANASITRTSKNYTFEDSEEGKKVAILDVECRGMELVKFIPQGDFQCKGAESSTKFEEIDLTEGEFYDYDDNKGEEVSITEVEWEIARS